MLLNCHTYYSLCYGTYSIEGLITEVGRQGYSSFALTDINNTSACINTIRLAKEAGIKAILGIDFRNGIKQQYVGLAINNKGFKELNAHLTLHTHTSGPFDIQAPAFNDSFIIYPLNSYKGWALRKNEFIGVSVKDLSTLTFVSSKMPMEKLVILQSLSFANKRNYNAHRLLRAIDQNTLLSKLPSTEQAGLDEMVLSASDIKKAFEHYPQIMANTVKILNECSVDFEYGKFANKNLKHYTGSMAGDIALLRAECAKGLEYRFKGNPSQEVLDRIEKELKVIEQMNFAAYFLINWDIVKYAQSKNYYYVGRGSGANSMLAYLLRITDVDPIKLDLYFERFINPFRTNPPDFDIDFSWTDRDEITEYIFKRFGRERTALLGAYNTFQHDAVIRELGKVFGLPPGEIDRLQAAHKYPDIDEIGKMVLRYSEFIQGFPSHLSIHSSGIIISEEPITAYSATFVPPKGYPTTQFSMLEAEDIGLYKFDILSQRGLGKIKDSLEIIKENKGVEIDIHNVAPFYEDEKVKELLREGKAIGCFYVESPAMRMLLAKLRADDYLRLVAASSIIRPGVAKSGMMREYIVRYRDKDAREKARAKLPELYDLLAETYGVMVYQEDVIKVAHFFAGLSLAEADYLRRGMSWKFKQRNEFWRVKENFFANCRQKGYDEKLVEDIWNQIESFANFAFSKGHSASYAVESFQALYLKAYYPLEYMVATLNNGGGFYRPELYVHEARKHGAIIEAPCVNRSEALCCIKGETIFLGLGMINEIEHQTVSEIIKARQEGPFKDIYDFVKRVPVSIEQMRLLVRIGALRFTGRKKKELLWEIHTMINPVKQKKHAELFEVEHKSWKLPELRHYDIEDAFDEMELLGFPLCSPFLLLKNKVPSELKAKELKNFIGQTISIVGYLITIKHTVTSKSERMHFGTFIDLDGDWIDTVHFPPSARQFPFTGPGCYHIIGKVVEEYDFISIEVSAMKRLAIVDREV